MNLLNFYRIIKQGVINFKRNGLLSTATVSIMAITLFVMGALFITTDLFQNVSEELQSKINITAYFKEDAPEEKILSARKFLLENSQVKNVEYVSKEEAYELFKDTHKDDPTITASLYELQSNPLPASLNIKAESPENYSEIAENLRKSEFSELIEKVNDKQNEGAIKRLASIISNTKKFGVILTAILGIIVVLVTFNTIRLTIYNHKQEIEIMKLVGGTNSFIRAPYIVEGLLYGIFASIISIGILYLAIIAVSSKITGFLPSSDLVSFYKSSFWMILFMEIAIGSVLGITSSFIAIRKYLDA
ncbi:MAG: permease-like cell division protein FtsX [bacterium]